jgi:hypothetical protein
LFSRRLAQGARIPLATSVRTQQVQVTCIRLSGPGPRKFESIIGIGGEGWRMTKAEAIAEIEAPQPRYQFYTEGGGKKAYVGVFKRDGVKYLRTYADGVWDNNLEALPDCP